MVSATRLLFVLAAALGVLVAPAGAEQYWIAYEGNDFPENEGWERTYGDGNWPPEDEPDRWLEDGALVIDTMRDPSLWEYYSIHRAIDPGPGELFIAEWRVRVDELGGWASYDPAVLIARDYPPGHALFAFDVDQFYAEEEDTWIPITPGQYHEYRFESTDMDSYDLFLDGVHVHSGWFDGDTFLYSYVAFGPSVEGGSSRSRWDFVRFGVIPEPNGVSLLAGGLLVQLTLRRRSAWIAGDGVGKRGSTCILQRLSRVY
jgi:hypothetical protein